MAAKTYLIEVDGDQTLCDSHEDAKAKFESIQASNGFTKTLKLLEQKEIQSATIGVIVHKARRRRTKKELAEAGAKA